MKMLNKKISIYLLYLFPYIIGVHVLAYYFDSVVGEYPTFLPPIVLILLLFPIYIGLGYMTGKSKRSVTAIVGTVLHVCIYRGCIYLLPLIGIRGGTAKVYFPIGVWFIIICQLIGYWGARPLPEEE